MIIEVLVLLRVYSIDIISLFSCYQILRRLILSKS